MNVRYTLFNNDIGELLSRPADTMRQAKIRARKLARDYNYNCYVQYVETTKTAEYGCNEKYKNGKWIPCGIEWIKTI